MPPSRAYGPILDAVRGLTWPARQRAAGTLTGSHRSRLRGRAPELSEYRLYRQGDDPRQLDWKLLARSDRPFVRLSEDRSVHPTFFVVDASASMDFPAAGASKWAMACSLVVALASIAQRAGDPVGGAIVAARGTVSIRPRTRADVVTELMTALGSVRPEGATPIAASLVSAPERARVVIVSDLLGDEEALRRACAVRASAGGDVHVLHIVSRLEVDPPPDARLVADPEDPSILRPLDAVARVAYRERFDAWRAETARAWRLAGAAYREVTAEDDPARVVRQAVSASPARP